MSDQHNKEICVYLSYPARLLTTTKCAECQRRQNAQNVSDDKKLLPSKSEILPPLTTTKCAECQRRQTQIAQRNQPQRIIIAGRGHAVGALQARRLAVGDLVHGAAVVAAEEEYGVRPAAFFVVAFWYTS